MRWAAAVLAVCGLLEPAGCGSFSKSATVGSSVNSSSISVPTAVSPGCDSALKALAGLSVPRSFNLSANPAKDLETADQKATLRECQSRAEWLAGAARYTSSGLGACVICAEANPADVLASFCQGKASDPACK
jgi:hypothetical protein